MAVQITQTDVPTDTRVDNWLIDAAAYACTSVSTVVLEESGLRQQWADYRTAMVGWTPTLMERRLATLLRRGLISVVEDDEMGQERPLAPAALEVYLANRFRSRLRDLLPSHGERCLLLGEPLSPKLGGVLSDEAQDGDQSDSVYLPEVWVPRVERVACSQLLRVSVPRSEIRIAENQVR